MRKATAARWQEIYDAMTIYVERNTDALIQTMARTWDHSEYAIVALVGVGTWNGLTFVENLALWWLCGHTNKVTMQRALLFFHGKMKRGEIAPSEYTAGNMDPGTVARVPESGNRPERAGRRQAEEEGEI